MSILWREEAAMAIRGVGLVTPLGNSVEEVWPRWIRGERATAEVVPGALPQPEGRQAWYCPVGLKAFDALGRTPRIRRSSAITYFSIAAGLEAMGVSDPKGATLPPERAGRTAVISAICSGGVHYTRRFYEKVVAEGAQAASPLLFPETVYNAPASHLAALLGIDGASYTIVGDGAVGLMALGYAQELLACQPELEECIIVGAEECDWILWEGYHSWRLLSGEPEAALHQTPARGMLLAEGGAAIVVGRSRGEAGEVVLSPVMTNSYLEQEEAGAVLHETLAALVLERVEAFFGSANGTWLDRSEASALGGLIEAGALRGDGLHRFYPKAALGDALGAGALWQVALGATALMRQELPGGVSLSREGEILVASLGLNQQMGGAVLRRL